MAAFPMVPLYSVTSVNKESLPDQTPPDNPISYIDISDVELGRFLSSGREMTFAEAPSRARRKASEGDILVSTVRTYLKAITPVDSTHSSCVFSTGFAVISPLQSAVISRYLNHVLVSSRFIDEVITHSNGVSYPAINTSDLMQIRIPLPDLDTQRRIADYLDKETSEIDTLVKELDEYVELLEKRNTQLVDHYISGEPVSLSLLSTYFDCVHTTPEPDEYGEFESVRTSSIRSGKFVQGQGITVSEETYKTRNRDISPEAGDLFFTREAPAGESCLVPESNTYCAGQRVVTIRPNREKILPSYLLWALNSSIAQDFFRLRSTGSTVGNIKMDTIGQVKIPVPEISEQRKIVKEIEKHLGRTDALIKECRELKEILLKRRQVLITDVVTGKVEV